MQAITPDGLFILFGKLVFLHNKKKPFSLQNEKPFHYINLYFIVLNLLLTPYESFTITLKNLCDPKYCF